MGSSWVAVLYGFPGWVPWCDVVGRIALAGTTVLGSPVDCLDESLACFGRDETVLASLYGPDSALVGGDFPCGTVNASPTAIMASKFMNFPGPKKGKGRMVIKRPAAKKTKAWKKTPYVRGHRDVLARGVRREHSHWQRAMPEPLKATDINIVKMLIKDKLLPNWSGKCCPKCNKGTLSSLQMHSSETKPKYRCNNKGCKQRIHPHYLHPLFQAGRGPSNPSSRATSASPSCTTGFNSSQHRCHSVSTTRSLSKRGKILTKSARSTCCRAAERGG